VTVAARIAGLDDDDETVRERRCIVTGEVLSDAELVRFVADPQGCIVPDIAAKLPGRGIWVSAKREILARAIAKNLFARAAKAPVIASSDLPERVEAQLVAHMLGLLGLARRSGALILGFDNVARGFQGNAPPALLIEASDGAADGRRKLLGVATGYGLNPPVMDCLTVTELSLALGRENVVHAALKSGRLSERLKFEAGRLKGFRAASQRVGLQVMDQAGSTPAPDKGQE
jgi:predicted RNA-binding protein YlxR (DUF448 family)